MKLTGAQATVRVLSELGVPRLYGIPGSQTVELYDELRDADFPVTLCTHELSGAFMAEATSRCTGRLGALTTVPGPGMTNALTGIGEAFLDSVPLLCIIPDVRNDLDQTRQLHQVPQADIARPICKALIDVTKGEELTLALCQAAERALEGEPGPVLVNVPFNLFMEMVPYRFRAPTPRLVEPPGAALDRAADLLRQARRPALYVGQGVFAATAELAELARLLQAPVATTLCGRGAIPEDDPLAVGFGWDVQGTAWAHDAFRAADVVLAVACTFGEVPTASYCMDPPPCLIHADVNEAVLGRNLAAAHTIHGDARLVLRGLVERLAAHPRDDAAALKERIRAMKEAHRAAVAQAPADAEGVSPARFLHALRARAARDAIITTDSGHHMFWVTPEFEIYQPRTLLTPADYQSMGFGVPATVAAQLAWPDREVIGVVGDGGFLMTGFELATAARHGAAVKQIVFNDGKLDLIAQQQQFAYKRDALVKLWQPDFAALAAGLGLEYVRIALDADIPAGLDRMFGSRAPMLIDVHVRYRRLCQFMAGAKKANVRRASLGQKWRFARRLLGRALFPPGPSERE